MDLEGVINSNNDLIKEALRSAKLTRKELELELIENYSPELFNKLLKLNKEISKVENLLSCTTSEIKDSYAKNNPDNVDEKGNINDKGLKRLDFLRKKFGFGSIFK